MYKITKEFAFSAGHHLLGLPEDHPCSERHGHNYVVKVELQSETLNEVGFVVDYRELSKLKEWIDKHLDHKYLNDVLGAMNPTAENMAKYFYHTWKAKIPQLSAVEVSETPKTNARYEG